MIRVIFKSHPTHYNYPQHHTPIIFTLSAKIVLKPAGVVLELVPFGQRLIGQVGRRGRPGLLPGPHLGLWVVALAGQAAHPGTAETAAAASALPLDPDPVEPLPGVALDPLPLCGRFGLLAPTATQVSSR